MPWAKPCGWSQMKGSASTARMPTSSAARAAAAGSSTVPASRKQVVPLRIISIAASATARYSSSSLTVLKNRLSKLSKASVSASWSGSAPRNSWNEAWRWHSINPGCAGAPLASITRAAA